jgi:hypothetical protein
VTNPGEARSLPVDAGVMIAQDPLRLAAARLAAEYVWRAEAWAGDVDKDLVLDLERVHRRLLDHIQDLLRRLDGYQELT